MINVLILLLPVCEAWLQLTDAGVGAHHQHGEVGAVAGEAEDGRLQVLVVSGQIDEGDHLGGALTDLLSCPRLAVVHNLQKTISSPDSLNY